MLHRTPKQPIPLLRIYNQLRDMRRLYILPLFLIAWAPVFGLAEDLVASTVGEVAAVDGGGDGGGVYVHWCLQLSRYSDNAGRAESNGVSDSMRLC